MTLDLSKKHYLRQENEYKSSSLVEV